MRLIAFYMRRERDESGFIITQVVTNQMFWGVLVKVQYIVSNGLAVFEKVRVMGRCWCVSIVISKCVYKCEATSGNLARE